MRGRQSSNKGKPSYYAKEKHHNWKGGAAKKTCAVCGQVFVVKRYRVLSAEFCSRVCKHRAQDHGLSTENEKIRHSKRYRLWRAEVFSRDNFTCLHCGKRGGTLNADHIKPFALFHELRFDVSNGQTLCRPCHLKTPTFGRKAIYRAQECLSYSKGY